jgi:hypothetical protein
MIQDPRGYARAWERREVNLPVKVEICWEQNDIVHATGKALVRNISLSGALLTKFVMDTKTFPARRFYLKIHFNGRKYKGMGAECRPVRFGKNDEFELAVEFDDLWAGELPK